MIYILGNHPVRDFDTWKPYFDSDLARATAAGIHLIHLFRGLDDPNSVSILFSAPSKEAFLAFFNNPVLPELMQSAGVLAPPSIQYFTEA
ncbi:MAG: hypothetical protein IT260_17445 [Saprospiraceae bacterium]|nr:hypothetical protein [Saprospiraceae bacterium]